MSTPYDDIIGLEHPTSQKHPRMARLDRAAQFAPFAALRGYEEVIEENREAGPPMQPGVRELRQPGQGCFHAADNY